MATVVLLDLLQHGLPLHPASLAVFFSLLLSTVLLISYYSNLSFPRWRPRPKLPPSPPKLPFIGNLHQLGRLPHHSLRDLSRRHGPLMHLQLGQVPTLVVSSAETAQEVLKANDLAFANRPRSRTVAGLTPGGKGLGFAPYGEYWRQARRISVVHLLSPHRVQRFRPAREEEVARLVGKISALCSSDGPINVSRILSSFTNSVICRAIVGESAVEEGTAGEIAELVAQSVTVLGGFQVDNFFPSLAWLGKFTGTDAKVAELAGRWRAVLRKLTEKATGREEGGANSGGFLDVLLSIQRDAAVGFVPSTDEIQGILLSLISAGTDTSFLVLEAALADLVRNPGVMKRAQEEVRRVVLQGKPVVSEDHISKMAYLKAVVKEALRLHPPAPLLLPRESMKPVQMRGYEIPNKTRVVINAWAIARDLDFWESPEEFWPERFLKSSSVDFRGNDFQFIPFGSGRRICPGMYFAVATIEVVLANLLYHFDWSRPKGFTAKELDTDETPGLTVHRTSSLLLVAKHKPSPSKPS